MGALKSEVDPRTAGILYRSRRCSHGAGREGMRARAAARIPLRARRFALVVAGAFVCATVSIPAAAAAETPVQAYGTNDAGGFRNVLPAGWNGLDYHTP